MKGKRRQHSPEFKAKVALAALKGDTTTHQLASDFDIHPLLIGQWKKAAVAGLADVFSHRAAGREKDNEALTAALYQQIGQLKVEWDWLKKYMVRRLTASGIVAPRCRQTAFAEEFGTGLRQYIRPTSGASSWPP